MKSACDYPLSSAKPARKPAILRSLFPRPDVSTVCYSLFSCMWLDSSTLVRMQIGDSEEKQSSVTLPVLITEP